MAIDSNNPKTASQEQAENTAATQEPIDVNSPISLERAQAVLEADEGNIEESIIKNKIEKDKEIAPDLKKLKEEQAQKKQKIVEKKEEIIEAEDETPEAIEGEPSKFAGKSEEERLKIYKDMESGYTKLSQKYKELETEKKQLEAVNAKIEEYEKNAVISGQKATSKLPEYPADELYYDDPLKYNKMVKAYNDAVLSATINPIYAKVYNQDKKEIISGLKEKTKNEFVTYSEVEKEVETRLKADPALFDLHKLGAREFMYNQIKAEMLPVKIEEIKKKAVEEAEKEKELKEESEDMKNIQVMSSDITTKRRESKPIDFAEQLDKGIDPAKVKEAIKKKYNIRSDF